MTAPPPPLSALRGPSGDASFGTGAGTAERGWRQLDSAAQVEGMGRYRCPRLSSLAADDSLQLEQQQSCTTYRQGCASGRDCLAALMR
mmetsp:Transcript_5720/g.12637  ORF Transcript_5720/g.12637 Transcript_5720/m.12637 type:complete len:88 (+) Transcript_5720:1860-2123(+)